MSPRAVRTFILGSDGKEVGGRPVERKIFGNQVLAERSIVTLAGQRGLLLAGEPGTAKSLLSELLAAAISGRSTLTAQGSAGTIEENIRYSWNYALLLRDGPTTAALVAGPLHQAMEQGTLMRFEEITRCPVEIQDLLLPVLSDRILHVPELKGEANLVLSRPGFNIITTANLKDRGVNEMSSTLKRRFNFETMQPLSDPRQESELVGREVGRMLAAEGIAVTPTPDLTELLVTLFQELRQARALGGPPRTASRTATGVSIPLSIFPPSGWPYARGCGAARTCVSSTFPTVAG